MSDGPSINGKVSFDTSEADKAFGRVETGAGRMAEAVKKAGASAAKGVDAIGDGAAAGVQKLDAATRSLIPQIQRTTALMEAGSRTSSKYFEAIAAQRGANLDALRPFLADLDAVAAKQAQATAGVSAGTGALKGMETSARQTAAALRGVPAQFTDIVTSLSSGQRPMQVLIQQGGQLKDMFGGIGPAARALGGYVAGLANPFTIAAGAILGVAYAAQQGGEELRAFQNAAALTGNAIGLSNSQFAELRKNIGAIATEGKAAEALTAIAQSGLMAGENVRGIAEAAILMEKATGQSIDKTVSQFKELARSPADAAAKLNEQYNFLTAAIYSQIKALEDQGRAVDAANLAERTYAEALKTRAQSVVDNAGFIEKAWRGIAGTAKSAWDAILGVGRSVSNGEQIAILQKNLQEKQELNRRLGIGDANGDGKATAEIKQQINLLQENERMERRLAESQAARAQITQQTIEWEKQGDQFLTKQALRERELTKAKVEGRALVNAGVITEQQLVERLNGIRQKYNETTGQSEVAAIVARTKSLQQYLTALKTQAATGSYSEPIKPTAGEELVTKLQNELQGSILGVARAEKERALAAAKSQAEVEKQIAIQERLNAVDKQSRELLEKQAEAAGKQADAIRQRAIDQEAANSTFGKSKTAIEEMTLAQLKHTAAQMDATETAMPAYVAGLRQQVAEQERYVAALKKSENQRLEKSLTESGRVSAEEAQTLQLELSLVGQTQLVRDRIIGQRQAELKLAKEIAEIDQSGASDEDKEKRRAQARANYQVDAANAANKAIVNEWQRTADAINNSLTDALLRGFESGKDFAQNFRDTLKNMFATLVLRPIIQGVMAPVSGAIGYGVNAVMGGGGYGGGGIGGMANTAQSAYSLYNNGSSLYTVGSQYAAGTMSAANAAGTVYANATGAGIDGLLATNGAYGTAAAEGAGAAAGAAGAGEGAASASGALAGMGPWGWAALAAIAIASYVGGRGEQRFGGQYNGTNLLAAPSGGVLNGNLGPQSIQGTQDSINSALKAMGSSQQLQGLVSGYESSGEGKGFAYAGGTLTGGAQFGQGLDGMGYMNRRGSKSAEQAFAEFTEELKQSTLEALQAADIKGKLAEYIKGLGNIEGLTGDALNQAYNRVATALTQRAQLQAKLDEMAASALDPLEQLAKAREAERKQIDETNQDLLDQIYAQQDLGTASANLVTAYSNQQQELQGTVNALRQYAKSLRGYVQGLAQDAQTSASARLALTSSRFDATLAAAHGGDADARAALTGTAGDYLTALKATARSASDYALGVAKVSSALSLEAASADSQATVQQQQLDAAKAQLTALGLINTSVLSFQDAWVAYQAAQGNVEAAKAASAAAAAITSTVAPTDPDAAMAYLRNLARQQIASTGFFGGSEPTGFAVGTNYVPYDMVAEIHEGERIVPKRDNPYANPYTSDDVPRGRRDDSGEVMRALLAEIKALRAEGRTGDVAVVGLLAKQEARWKKWDNQGQPPVRTTA